MKQTNHNIFLNKSIQRLALTGTQIHVQREVSSYLNNNSMRRKIDTPG